jgi:hypothetical protein
LKSMKDSWCNDQTKTDNTTTMIYKSYKKPIVWDTWTPNKAGWAQVFKKGYKFLHH